MRYEKMYPHKGVTGVTRIKVRRNNELLPTNTFVLHPSIKAGYLNIPVEPFIQTPLRCFKYQRFGHVQNRCPRCDILMKRNIKMSDIENTETLQKTCF